MAENPHYRELLQLLNEFEAEYLIVGGFAVMKYGEPRYTKDLDVWVHNSPQNSARVVGALRKFGAPLEHDEITPETFTGKQVVYQIGIAPVRIDILTEITGVEFPDAWRKRVASTFFGIPREERTFSLRLAYLRQGDGDRRCPVSACLSAVQHLRKLRGGSQSHLFQASDGACYVTKFQNNPQHIWVLANEMLATRLGLALGLPMPRVTVIEVSEWLIEHTEDLRIQLAGTRKTRLVEHGFPDRLPASNFGWIASSVRFCPILLGRPRPTSFL